MKRSVVLSLPAIAVFLLAVCSSIGRSAAVYHVSEITRVLSGVSFECRLANSPYAAQARCQVLLKDVQPNPDSPMESLQTLEKTLRAATAVELCDATLHNYFRIEARVRADGRDVAEELIAANTIQAINPQQPQTSAEIQTARKSYEIDETPVVRISELVPAKVTYASYSLPQLMRTKVDLSLLRAETPFGEALRIISESMEPRLPMLVLWADIQNNAYVDKETPIGVDGFGRVSVAMALDSVLYSVSGYGIPLKFTIKDGILKIGTVLSLSQKTTKVYSVLDLVSPPSYDMGENDYGSGGAGSGIGGGYSGAR